MIDRLPAPERQLLFKFLCAFAWADGEVGDAERRFVRRLMEKLPLTKDERLDVESWMVIPLGEADVDPGKVPAESRRVFLEACRALVFMDGKVTDEEQRQFDALRVALSK